MENNCNNNLIVCPVNVERIYDVNKTTNKLSSNLPIKFNILSNCVLPCDSKIEILETRFQYNLCNVKKRILINGHKVEGCFNNIYDIVYLNNRYINLADENCKELCLSITEHIEVNLKINACIKCVAHTCNCKKIYFEAVGEGTDELCSIITSKFLVPNFKKTFEKPYLILKNEIIGLAKPEYIYLSPIYGTCCDIEKLLGNVFINYCINFDLKTIIPCCLNVFCKKC
ncbi:hypothetical protein LPC27_13550 [Paraclostridium bifermentans]|uniref:hypothetical protein n=1 Tax=Paraclostridium bifermentans TaxID=1490 RepID=UPI001F18EC06|nr:hypothetical protein [Paraclostridium bifermentans]MCE9676795.1 hypothetical protein [Paraclostridium bifermentans]